MEQPATRQFIGTDSEIDKIHRTHQLLTRFELKKTKVRQSLLLYFLSNPGPQSHQLIWTELQKLLPQIDAVTLYRNLQRFVDIGILHKLPGPAYLLCAHFCCKNSHILFQCSTCDSIQEIDDEHMWKTLSDVLSHQGEIDQTQAVILRGVCRDCCSRPQA